jgi:hypothetical protein
VNDQSQPKEPSETQADEAQRTGYRRNEGRDGDGRPKADPILTKRFEALEKTLHGSRRPGSRPPLNWSGADERAVVFGSIEKALHDAIPPNRISDRPEESDTSEERG